MGKENNKKNKKLISFQSDNKSVENGDRVLSTWRFEQTFNVRTYFTKRNIYKQIESKVCL